MSVTLLLLAACDPEPERARWEPPADDDGVDTDGGLYACATRPDGELARTASAVICGDGPVMAGWSVGVTDAAAPGVPGLVVAAPYATESALLLWQGGVVGRHTLDDADRGWTPPGPGSLRAAAVLPLGDLDGDGFAELASTMGDPSEPAEAALLVWPGAGGEPRLFFAPPLLGAGGTLATGDVTGDGAADLVVRPAGCGLGVEAWVLDADATATLGHVPALRVGSLQMGTAQGAALRGGAAISDIDGDGIGDLALTCATLPGAWILEGPLTGDRSLETADAHFGPMTASGGLWTETLAGGHDLDGDGLEDYALGVSGAVLVHGRAGGATVLLGAGEQGPAVALPGDVDGDGIADMALGRPFYGGDRSGAAVVFGPLSGQIDVDDRGIELDAPSRFQAGTDVAGGDLDGDTLVDLVIGAPGADGGAGAVFVVYGSALGGL